MPTHNCYACNSPSPRALCDECRAALKVHSELTDDKRKRARVEYEPRIVSVRKVIEAVKH